MSSKEKVPGGESAAYFRQHPVFTLGQMATDLGLSTPAAHERCKHHTRQGHLKRVARGLYAVVPPSVPPHSFVPDKYLVTAAARPDGVFCFHAALELLGVAQSQWTDCTVFTQQRRAPIRLGQVSIRFLLPPAQITRGCAGLAETTVHRQGISLQVTTPERTLVEGLRKLQNVGGLEELWASASGFKVLDLSLLIQLLECYGEQYLWGAVGWFLESHQEKFFVPKDLLERLERCRPRSPRYVIRRERGGELNHRWNLILPPSMALGEEGEP